MSLPDPFLKLRLCNGRDYPKLSHHSQQLLSSVQYDTVQPNWDTEVGVVIMGCDSA